MQISSSKLENFSATCQTGSIGTWEFKKKKWNERMCRRKTAKQLFHALSQAKSGCVEDYLGLRFHDHLWTSWDF